MQGVTLTDVRAIAMSLPRRTRELGDAELEIAEIHDIALDQLTATSMLDGAID